MTGKFELPTMPSCTKLPYASRSDAKRAMDKVGRGAGRPYRCAECGAWHLTTHQSESKTMHRIRKMREGEWSDDVRADAEEG